MAVTVPVTDPNWLWAPYTTYSDGAGALGANNVRAGSTYAQWNLAGGYCKLGFSGTSIAVNMDTAPLTAGAISTASWPVIRYSVDNGAFTDLRMPSTGTVFVSVTGLAAGSHTLSIFFERGSNSGGHDRWTAPANVARFTGAALDDGASAVAPSGAIARRSKNAILYGDSIVEGLTMLGLGVGQGAQETWAHYLGVALDAELGQVGCGSQGWTHTGVGNYVPLPSAWDKYHNNASRLFSGLLSPAPDYVICNHGANERTSLSGMTAGTVSDWLAAVRAAAPTAWICMVAPFGQWTSGVMANISTGTAAYKAAAGDSKVVLIDLGVPASLGINVAAGGTPTYWSTDGVHPGTVMHAMLGAQVASAIKTATAATGPSSRAPAGHAIGAWDRTRLIFT